LPLLESWNPRLREHLTHMAELARAEEAWWQAEVVRLAPQLILPGRPVRGGGRAAAGGLAIDLTRLAELVTAMQRRLIRHVAEQIGVALDFAATEALRELALKGRAGQKSELEGLRAERTARELRLEAGPKSSEGDAVPVYWGTIPGEMEAAAFGLKVRIEGNGQGMTARLRTWAPGDRVRLRYSGSAKKVKEILERMRVTGSDRMIWPVLEVGGRIVWMKGVEVEPEAGLTVRVETLERLPGDRDGHSTDGG
jgi:tRNA(Ile)-lysidine synthase